MSRADLSPAALALLPAADDAPRCATFAGSIGLDPGGTAIAADAVIVIEVPLPWPKPVFAHADLDGLMSMMALSIGPTRVLAAVPHDANDRRVLVWRRTGSTATASIHRPAERVAFVQGLTDSDAALVDGEPTDPNAVLICTQGSHDVCCGADGVVVAGALEAADHQVFRVSHTGGHRFAPTAMTLPAGRMWAYMTADELAAVANDPGAASQHAAKCRGWWGAATGPAQIAERSVWERTPTPTAATVEVDEIGDGTWRCTVGTDDGPWVVQIAVGREVPTIACRAAGGLPAKPAREYEVVSISRG